MGTQQNCGSIVLLSGTTFSTGQWHASAERQAQSFAKLSITKLRREKLLERMQKLRASRKLKKKAKIHHLYTELSC